MNMMNLLVTFAFIALLGMIIALSMNDKALFLTNALFLSVIVMHDLFKQMSSPRKK
jgi:hypothetical protein